MSSIALQGSELLILHQVFDPRKYYLVTFALFCNGEVCCHIFLQSRSRVDSYLKVILSI